MFVGPAIPFTLLAARECRESRAKYIRQARNEISCSECRKIDLELARMFKRHEKAWISEYMQ